MLSQALRIRVPFTDAAMRMALLPDRGEPEDVRARFLWSAHRKLQRTTQPHYTTLVRAKVAPLPERHSSISRVGNGGTDMKRASARSYFSHRRAGVLEPRREFAFPPWSRPELRWTRAGRRRRGVCRGWGAAGQPGGSSRRLCARDATSVSSRIAWPRARHRAKNAERWLRVHLRA